MDVTNFDLLIVYSERGARSSSSYSDEVSVPFSAPSRRNYNDVYGYFLETCKKRNLKAAFTTSADIIGAGKCKSFWLYGNGVWTKIHKTGYSKFIFDKLSPTQENLKARRNLLFSSKRIKPFNNPELFNLCFDKQKTYNKLNEFSIPTVTVKSNTKIGINNACKALDKQRLKLLHKNDFYSDIVIKDRFGAGGFNVYKLKDNQQVEATELVEKHKTMSFIIQPFVKFDKGRCTDIRLIYLREKLVQAYLRIAPKGEFRCNEHTGGLLKYISINKVPLKVSKVAKNILKSLNTDNALFALDFVISNNGNVYLMEANTGPGLDWNVARKENEVEAKKLIEFIVEDMKKRIKPINAPNTQVNIEPSLLAV